MSYRVSLAREINCIGQHLGICNYYVPRTYNCIDKITGIVNLVLFNSHHNQMSYVGLPCHVYVFLDWTFLCAAHFQIYYTSGIWTWKGSWNGPVSTVIICIRTSCVCLHRGGSDLDNEKASIRAEWKMLLGYSYHFQMSVQNHLK